MAFFIKFNLWKQLWVEPMGDASGLFYLCFSISISIFFFLPFFCLGVGWSLPTVSGGILAIWPPVKWVQQEALVEQVMGREVKNFFSSPNSLFPPCPWFWWWLQPSKATVSVRHLFFYLWKVLEILICSFINLNDKYVQEI